MTYDEIVAYLASKGVKDINEFSESVLDDLVFDMKSEEASALNSSGPHAQLVYILEGLSSDESVKNELDGILTDHGYGEEDAEEG